MSEGIHEQNKEAILSIAEKYLSDLLKTLRFESSMADVNLSSLDPSLSADKTQEIINKVRLTLGKKFLYISRKDILDNAASYVFPKQVARLKIEDGKTVELFIDEEKFLSDTFKILESSIFFRILKEQFNIADPAAGEQEALSHEINLGNAQIQEKERRIREMEELSLSNRTVRETLNVPDSTQVKVVKQGEIGFIDESDSRKYLETIGADSCIVVVAFNPEKQILGLTHMDALTDSLLTIQKLLQKVGVREVSILGGDSTTLDILLEIKNFLEAQDISVKEWDVLNTVKSVIVDKQTGKIYDVLIPTQGGTNITIADIFSKVGRRQVAKEVK